jgi:hypothetical protein
LKACAARRASPNCAGARESSRTCITAGKDFLEAGKKRLAGDTARAAGDHCHCGSLKLDKGCLADGAKFSLSALRRRQ